MNDHETDLKARLQNGLNAGHREGSCGLDCGFDNEAAVQALEQALEHVVFGRSIPDVDALAQEIRRVDGTHTMGAGALAEAIVAFLRKQPLHPLNSELPDDIVKLVTPFAAACNGTWQEHLDIVKAMTHCVMLDRLARFGNLIQEPPLGSDGVVTDPDFSYGQPAIERRTGGWFVTGPNWSGPWFTEEAAELAKDGEYVFAHDANRVAVSDAAKLRSAELI